MTVELNFWTIIDVDESKIPELKRLENLLNKFLRVSYDKNDLSTDIYALIGILEKLCETSYPIFKNIDINKRKQLFDCILNKLQHLADDFRQILDESTWTKLLNQTNVFKKLCLVDFNMKPLLFAQKAFDYKNLPTKFELELIELIKKMRKKYPKTLNDILEEEYKQLQTNYREKIVISVLGSAKASKSSIINFLLENEICPTGNQAATARLTKIMYGQQIWLTLFNSQGIQPEKYFFSNNQDLLKKARELIVLKDRKSKSCEDEIMIELPIEELKGIELWDIPGFDENHVINNRITEILKDTDLILAVLPQHEMLRQTAIDFIKPCLQRNKISDNETKTITKICFIISQIDKYNPDVQSNQTKEQFLQHIYQKIRTELSVNFQQHDYKLCDQFIPLCTNPKHSMKDYLECRKEFIKKSCLWFKNAIYDLTINRTNFLLKCLREFSIIEEIYRQEIRYRRTRDIFNRDFLIFKEQLTRDMEQSFVKMRSLFRPSVEGIVMKCRNLFNNGENYENIEEYIQKQIASQLKVFLNNNTSDLMQMINTTCITFSNTIELKPTEIQILKQTIDCTLAKDHYTNIIGQYQHTSPYHLSAYLSRIFSAFAETLHATVSIPLGGFVRMEQAVGKFITHEQYVEETTMKSIQNLLVEILENISDKLQGQIEVTLKNILDRQLNQIQDQIEKKASKYIHVSINDTKIDYLRQFYTDNLEQITSIYLNVLDIQFNLDYSSCYSIDRNDRIDQNCNFSVYGGTLKKEKLPIAAKLIPLKDFKLQEVLYIRELKHKNVIEYYGVTKADEYSYYIIMPRFDCNLLTYLRTYPTIFNPSDIDDMIRQIITGLDYIHTQLELIHRDIKLENIFVDKKEKRFLIADLGGVHREPITYVFTKGYTAPELFSDTPLMITEKYDIFSLGIVIKNIMKISQLEKSNVGLINGWLKLAERCCSDEPSARPTCKRLLEKRDRHNL